MRKIFHLIILGFILTPASYAQSASATWALTADTASIVAGNITAPVQFLSKTAVDTDTLTVKDYAGSTSVGAAERIWLNGTAWPTDTGKNIGRYIQYSVSPSIGNNLTVQSITLNLGCSGTSTKMYASIYCSADSTFAAYVELYPATLLLDIRPGYAESFAALSFTPNVFVDSGKTFYIRIYPWYTTTPSASKYVCITNVVISGTTVAAGDPSLLAAPTSLAFGTANINTSRNKSFSISGTLLSPASGDIIITAPDDFTVSTTNGSGYLSSITLPYTGGTLIDTKIYAQFTPAAAASYTGNILVSGGGALTQSVPVTGTGVASDVVLGIFVSTVGSDTNSGTIDFPFASIAKAVSAAQAGDTIFIRGGNYSLASTITLSANGADSSNRRYLFAYGNERPILDFSSMIFGNNNKGIILNGDYWHIKGLYIQKAGDNGMYIAGSNNIVELCELYENRDSGLQLHGTASNNRIINCDSYFNCDDSTKTLDIVTPGGNADGFAPKQMTGVNNYFYGCRAWLNSDDGWDCFEAVASVIMENCWTWKNGYLKDGITTNDDMNGNGFKLGGNSTDNDAALKNCLAFQNKSKGFDQNSNKGSMTLYNCTGYNNIGNNYSIYSALSAGKTLTITNCVEFGNKRNIGAFADTTTNSWMKYNVTAADFVSLDTTGVSGQRKTDGGLPEINYMHLAPGSLLINAGTDIGLPYNGTAPDLGCFESDYTTGVASESNGAKITGYQLRQNYPNPFNPSTEIRYDLPIFSIVKLSVYDILGQEVAVLVNGQKQPGSHYVNWNASRFSSGLYFIRLSAQIGIGQPFVQTRKMLLAK